MYLKEIKTFGFKSFADKTTLEFSPSINGIVGPNGSGKSNVVDAVKFVLGEQSIKTLRGESNIIDIIFSGSKSRKPLNSASVTLIFDNTDHFLPLDFSEVSIKRVVYKTGDTEYFINNERCRLKNITDLLIDSGASKESFSIISQGKISEIISSKPHERRIVFEEAAGVLKYKKRKEEALRKLERTNDNLNRINDIISELNIQIEPLRIQSENAKIYLENKERLEELEISLIINDIEKFNFEFQEIKSRIELINDEIITMGTNTSSNNVYILENKEKLKLIEENISIKQNSLLEMTEKLENVNTEIKLLKEREKYKINKDNLKENILKLKDEKLSYNSLINSLNNEIEIKNKELENIVENISSIENKLNIEKNIFNSLNDDTIKTNRCVNDIKYKIDYLENKIFNNNGLPSGVINILNNPKLNGVHNIIGKLIDVSKEYAEAINTALGVSSSNIVVDNEKVAANCIKYLKENKLGRATFYPINIIKSREINMDIFNLISSKDGFINLASSLVKCEEKYKDIILNLLGPVIVVRDIETANNISSVINHRYKIVTLDGQIINIGGSITGGDAIKINSVIKDKYDLDSYNNELIKLNNKILNNDKVYNEKIRTIKSLEESLYNLKSKNMSINDIINNKKGLIDETTKKLDSIHSELGGLKNIIDNVVSEEENKLINDLEKLTLEKDNIKKSIEIQRMEKINVEELIESFEEETRKSNTYVSKRQKELQTLEIRSNRLDVQLDNLLSILTNTYNMTYDNAKSKYKLEIDAELAREKVNEFKEKLQNIGIVNIGAIDEYERINKRYEFLTTQKNDLIHAETSLLKIIEEMDSVMETLFIETFKKVKLEFKEVFKKLFKGGDADLILTNPDNLLETGIEIIAQPPGKTLKSISALSGGEMTFTAISLLFSILNVKQYPFCIFDEVEAALDEVNVDSFGKYLSMYKDKTQFIVITHKKKTMEYVDVLYGITMQESGVSKLVSVKLDEINK